MTHSVLYVQQRHRPLQTPTAEPVDMTLQRTVPVRVWSVSPGLKHVTQNVLDSGDGEQDMYMFELLVIQRSKITFTVVRL